MLAIAVIMLAQALVMAHAFEHPVLDPHPCSSCCYCQSAAHAVTGAAEPALKAVLPAWFIPALAINHTLAHTPKSSIRAPPLPIPG